jgi:hypothetical protein
MDDFRFLLDPSLRRAMQSRFVQSVEVNPTQEHESVGEGEGVSPGQMMNDLTYRQPLPVSDYGPLPPEQQDESLGPYFRYERPGDEMYRFYQHPLLEGTEPSDVHGPINLSCRSRNRATITYPQVGASSPRNR